MITVPEALRWICSTPGKCLAMLPANWPTVSCPAAVDVLCRRSKAGLTDSTAPLMANIMTSRAAIRPGSEWNWRSIFSLQKSQVLQVVGKGLDIAVAADRLARPARCQGDTDVGAAVALVFHGAVDTDLIPGIDQGVGQFHADGEGAAAADTGAAEAVKLARVHGAATCPVAQVPVVLGLLAGDPKGFLVLAVGVGDVNRQVRTVAAVVLELGGQGHFAGLGQPRQGNGAGEASCCNDFFHEDVLVERGGESLDLLADSNLKALERRDDHSDPGRLRKSRASPLAPKWISSLCR